MEKYVPAIASLVLAALGLLVQGVMAWVYLKITRSQVAEHDRRIDRLERFEVRVRTLLRARRARARRRARS